MKNKPLTLNIRLLGILIAGISLVLVIAGTAHAVRFSHEVHRDNEVSECEKCHKPLALSITPERSVCMECHTQEDILETVLGPTKTHTPLWVNQHGRASAEPDAECSSCHTLSSCADCHKGGELNPDLTKRTVRTESVPETHTSRFRVVHPLKATGAQIEECLTCHTEKSCSDCHSRTQRDRLKIVSHRESWTKIEAGAGGPLHKTFTLSQCGDCHPGGALSSQDWSIAHAAEARKTLKSCQTCHSDGNVCLDCHSAKTGL
ncbi:MAG: cytochrome c3 family protein, partial [bacterium]